MLEGISVELMVCTAAMFIVFIFALNSILYKPLIGLMEKRDKIIHDNEEFVKENSNCIDEYNAEIKAILSDAKSEAFKIRQNLLDKYKAKYDEALSVEKQKLEKSYDEFLSKLEADKADFEAKLMLEFCTYKQDLKELIQKL